MFYSKSVLRETNTLGLLCALLLELQEMQRKCKEMKGITLHHYNNNITAHTRSKKRIYLIKYTNSPTQTYSGNKTF